IQGTVKGLPAGVTYYGDLTKSRQTATKKQARDDQIGYDQLALLFLVATGILIVIAVSKRHSHAPNTLWWLYLAAGCCMAAVLLLTKIVWSRRLPRELARA